MQLLKIALDRRESQHGIPRGGLIPVATNLSEVSGKMHEVHFFTRRVSQDRIIEGFVCHFCLSEGNDIHNCCHDLNILQKVLLGGNNG
jgi:hypothetical protein